MAGTRSARPPAACGPRLQRPVADAGRGYQVLVSAAGTSPGTLVGGVLVPLNADRAFGFALAGQLRTTVGEDFIGSLDGAGRAEAAFHLDPQWAWTFVGETFHFAALLSDQGRASTSSGRSASPSSHDRCP